LDEKATNLIMSLLSNTKIGIITKYRTTDLFKVTRRVRQGDIISPILFMIWINPLIEYIEIQNKEYVMNNTKTKVSILVFANDIALFTKNNKDMHEIFKIISDFCDHSGMEISPTKSAYSCNNTKIETLSIYKNKSITKITKSKSYKYLEIEINMDLN
jgi:hypothetical protein